MRIVVHGQQAFGKAVLEALLKRGETIVAVYCGPEKEGQKIDPLKEAAVAKGLPVFQPKSYRKPEVWEQFASLKSDLCVMAYVTLFVPEEVLNLPTHGTIQYHPSLLPKHRGPSSINWPLIWGEKKTGLSIFWPDNGLDTGPILLQKEVPIQDDDTLGSIYFDKLFPMGVEAMLEGVDLVKAGKAPKIKQDESQATYEGWCKAENVEIAWAKPVHEVYNLIRGASPQPGAWTKVQGKTVQVFESLKVAGGSQGATGEVLAVDDKGLLVAAQGGQILIQRVRPEGGAKTAAQDFAKAAGIKPGARLGA
jgi:methionyl-tRNA formyltransferase